MRIRILILLFVGMSALINAQSDYLKFRSFYPYTWMIGGGWSFADNDGISHAQFLNLQQGLIANFYPSHLFVDRYLQHNFSLELGMSFNQFSDKKMVNEAFHAGHSFALDFNVRYSFYRYLQRLRWLDPYIGLGVGYTRFQTDNVSEYPTANGIVGVNFWMKNFGIRLQGTAKFGLVNDIYYNDANYMHYTAAMMYRFPKSYATKTNYHKPRHKWTKEKPKKYKGRSK